MAALSDYLESALLNHIFKSGEFPKPSSLSIALTSGVPLDTDDGSTIPELPLTIQKGENTVNTNYARINLGNPAESGNFIWNNVGVDESTTYHVYGTSATPEVGVSGYFYPLYLSQTKAINEDILNGGIGIADEYSFNEFPGVTFYTPSQISVSGSSENPNYNQYEGNGFIKNANQLVFNTALEDWGWVSGVAILDSDGYGSGNLLMYSKLTNPRYVFLGDNIKFNTNSLEISLK